MAPRIALGTSPNTLEQRRGMPLQHHEVQQLAYLVAATLADDPVSSPDRFRVAGQTLHDVRLLLKHGRGNVLADDQPSGGHNVVGAGMAYHGRNGENRMALAAALGAGFCDQFARLAAISHAPHLRDDEKAVNAGGKVGVLELNDDHTVSAIQTGHAWNELRRDHGRRDPESTIVQDGWSNGPVVRLKDSAWANVRMTGEELKVDREAALRLKDRIEQLAPLVHPDNDPDNAKTLAYKRQNRPLRDRFLEAQVVAGDFAERARNAVAEVPHAIQAQVVATTAQQLYGLPEHQAHDPGFIRSVLEQVMRLDHQDRPPVVAPDY
jgi:hypothetical protein